MKGISSLKLKELQARMRKLKVDEKDLKETFVQSPGKGGENVNKVATCVDLTHVPTGIRVKYHKERSQAINRYRARGLLLDKIVHERFLEQQQALKSVEKERRQKRKRFPQTKEKLLADKKHHSLIKKQRSRVSVSGEEDDQ